MVKSVIPWFLEVLDVILNIFPLQGVPECACCVLVCAWCTCMCIHSLKCARACLEDGIVTLLLSLKIGWHHNELIEKLWSDVSFFHLKTGTHNTWTHLCVLSPPLCHGFYFLFFVTIQTNSFIPSPPTSACTVAALWA